VSGVHSPSGRSVNKLEGGATSNKRRLESWNVSRQSGLIMHLLLDPLGMECSEAIVRFGWSYV
jgi:hypothetical protein